jgi:hypothetical protein
LYLFAFIRLTLSNKISLFGLCAYIRGYLAPSIGQLR